MKLVLDYVEDAKEKTGIKSDMAFGKHIGGTDSMVKQWRNRGSTPEDYYCIRIAEILGIDPLEVIAAANWEREKNQEKKDWWESFRKAHAGKVVGAVLLGVIALPSPPAKAEFLCAATNQNTNVYYVKLKENKESTLGVVFVQFNTPSFQHTAFVFAVPLEPATCTLNISSQLMISTTLSP